MIIVWTKCLKNFINCCIGIFLHYSAAVYSFAKIVKFEQQFLFAGGNPFCGGSQFFSYAMPYDLYPKWFFQVFFDRLYCSINGLSEQSRVLLFEYK